MRRVATFIWRTPPPTSVDEELALYDDGSAWLVVRRPMTQAPTIGTFSQAPEQATFDELAQTGPGPIVFDLLGPADERTAALMAAANRAADSARAAPVASAAFYARPMGAPSDGRLSVALQVVAAGKRTVQFQLDPARCAVHFSNLGQPAGWVEFPVLETGFITPEAEGLGGLNRRAAIDPGGWGSLVVDVAAPAAVTAVAAQVAGTLYEGLPDYPEGTRFMVRTQDMDIGPLA